MNHQRYGDTEGPLGFPMFDAEAKALDAIIKQHPGGEYERAVVEKATLSVVEGERSDVSWIQTDTIDRYGEIVLASGFSDTFYSANPLVTVNHNYYMPPVGLSASRKRVKEGDKRGIKAKTMYPARPDEWPADEDWPSDSVWALVKCGLMAGKSIGFFAKASHAPTDDEVKKRPELANVRRIVDQWELLEYAVCWLPVNPDAVVEAVAKSMVRAEDLRAFGVELPAKKVGPVAPRPEPLAHTPAAEVEKAIQRRLAGIDFKGMVEEAVRLAYETRRGRV
jgi:hypothetical protein